MLLYDSPVSGDCYKVRLLPAQLGSPYEGQTVDLIEEFEPERPGKSQPGHVPIGA